MTLDTDGKGGKTAGCWELVGMGYGGCECLRVAWLLAIRCSAFITWIVGDDGGLHWMDNAKQRGWARERSVRYVDIEALSEGRV